MVIFTLYFELKMSQNDRKQYTENNTMTHKEWVEAGTYTHI